MALRACSGVRWPVPVIAWLLALIPFATCCGQPDRLTLSPAIESRCVAILREGLASDEFWPAMHAAEGLTAAGFGSEVLKALPARQATETDAQKRCGLARELVRAGDLSQTAVLLAILADPDPYGHIHACESLYKIWQIGDGRLMRQALTDAANPKKQLMAAAALARWGNPEALPTLRQALQVSEGDVARIAAWVLGRVGTSSDISALKAGADRFEDPLTKAYFHYAAAALGDSDCLTILMNNLKHTDSAVRIYAGEFAPDARALAAQANLEAMLDDEVLDARIRAAHALLALAQPPGLKRTEAFQRDVFPASRKNPRYSEGSIAVLNDGRLLFAITEFSGSGSDAAKAQIIAVESSDQGQTWSKPRVLQENTGGQNVMSATLRRLDPTGASSAPLGFMYLEKNSPHDLQAKLRISADDGQTFGLPIPVTSGAGYHVCNNDRLTILSTGRYIVPVAMSPDVEKNNHFQSFCFFSDDAGQTWRKGTGTVAYAKRGAMEPEVLELKNGHLLMHFRTQLGHLAVSESTDGGNTWSKPRDWGVTGPESPATLRRIPSTGDLMLVWNHNPKTGGSNKNLRRTPLSLAISQDEGKTWSKPRDLEVSQQQTYAYTSILFDRGRAVLSYYVGDNATGQISTRFHSVPLSWCYENLYTIDIDP